uniref:Uncharacterized protein n=1 Tax=Anopheles farauti TaxID=69004 RepID=A0A182Q090_9DIPT
MADVLGVGLLVPEPRVSPGCCSSVSFQYVRPSSSASASAPSRSSSIRWSTSCGSKSAGSCGCFTSGVRFLRNSYTSGNICSIAACTIATLAAGGEKQPVAPVQVILPDDQIEAVVYGRRSFIVTIPFSRRNSTLRNPFATFTTPLAGAVFTSSTDMPPMLVSPFRTIVLLLLVLTLIRPTLDTLLEVLMMLLMNEMLPTIRVAKVQSPPSTAALHRLRLRHTLHAAMAARQD